MTLPSWMTLKPHPIRDLRTTGIFNIFSALTCLIRLSSQHAKGFSASSGGGDPGVLECNWRANDLVLGNYGIRWSLNHELE